MSSGSSGSSAHASSDSPGYVRGVEHAPSSDKPMPEPVKPNAYLRKVRLLPEAGMGPSRRNQSNSTCEQRGGSSGGVRHTLASLAASRGLTDTALSRRFFDVA